MLFSGKKIVLSLGLHHTKNCSEILKYSKVSIPSTSVQRAEKTHSLCFSGPIVLFQIWFSLFVLRHYHKQHGVAMAMLTESASRTLGSGAAGDISTLQSKEEDDIKGPEGWAHLLFWFKLLCLEESKHNYLNNWAGRLWGFNTTLFP